MIPTLGRRALNRALLARQLLLERSDREPLEVVEHLVGMQAQAPLAPYVALWSRLTGFAPESIATPLEARDLVRGTMMRGTVHLATARDFLGLYPLVAPVIERGTRGAWGRRLGAVPVAALVDRTRELLDAAPRTRVELRGLLAEIWPDADPEALAYVGGSLQPTVQVTPRGVWGSSATPALTTVGSWLGREPGPAPSIDEVVTRYLAAFGPATVADVQAWSGLTRLREVVERLAPGLLELRGDDGAVLWDLPEAPRPDPGIPAPPRFLPEYDNVLLSHADRSRVIPDGRRVPLPPGNGAREGTLLIDGDFRATWTTDADGLRITVDEALAAGEVEAITTEGAALLAFLGTGGTEVRVSAAGSRRGA